MIILVWLIGFIKFVFFTTEFTEETQRTQSLTFSQRSLRLLCYLRGYFLSFLNSPCNASIAFAK